MLAFKPSSGGSSGQGNNPYSWGPYVPPSPEATLAAEATVTVPTGDWVNQICSDASGSPTQLNWQGNGLESIVRDTAGTMYFRYPSGGSLQTKLLMSPAGGGLSGSVWTTLKTYNNALDYNCLLRDMSQNTIFMLVPQGSSEQWQLTCDVFDGNNNGNLLLSYQLPKNYIFLEGLTTNPYIRAGIGADGRFCLIQPLEPWPVNRRRQTTKQLKTILLIGIYSRQSNSFTFDDPVFIYTDERWAYHIPFIGINGDPDHICWLAGRDVLLSEDYDEVTKQYGVSAAWFNFDQIALFYYNRRTKNVSQAPILLTGKQGFLAQKALVEVSYTNPTASMTINRVFYGRVRKGQTITHVQDLNTVGNGTNVPTDLNGLNISSATGGQLTGVVNLSGAPAATRANQLILLTDPVGSTPTRRNIQAIKTNDGYIAFAYTEVRQTEAGDSSLSSAVEIRIMKCSAFGHIVFDEEAFSEGSTYALNYNILWQHGNGNLYLIRIVNTGSAAQINACRIREYQSCNCPSVTGTGSQTFTVNSIDPGGYIDVGTKIQGTNVPARSYIIQRGTGTGGTGTYVCNNAIGAGVTAINGYARAQCEPPVTANSLMTTWGASRAPGFAAWVPDDRSGSKVSPNCCDLFIPTRANDFPTNTSASPGDKVNHYHVRLA